MMPAIKKRYEMYAEYQDLLMSKRNREKDVKKTLIKKKIVSESSTALACVGSNRNSPDHIQEHPVQVSLLDQERMNAINLTFKQKFYIGSGNNAEVVK